MFTGCVNALDLGQAYDTEWQATRCYKAAVCLDHVGIVVMAVLGIVAILASSGKMSSAIGSSIGCSGGVAFISLALILMAMQKYEHRTLLQLIR